MDSVCISIWEDMIEGSQRTMDGWSFLIHAKDVVEGHAVRLVHPKGQDRSLNFKKHLIITKVYACPFNNDL